MIKKSRKFENIESWKNRTEEKSRDLENVRNWKKYEIGKKK